MSRNAGNTGPVTSQRTFDAPMTIGVISDTHIYTGSRRIIHPEIIQLFQRARVGLIVHLGDVNTRNVLDELAEYAPVIAVAGNNDDDELQFTLPEAMKISVGPFTFGLVHGHGGRSGRDEAIRRWGGKVDCVLFGHSHKPLLEKVGTTVLFNPGSATERRWNPHFGIGLIRVTADDFTPDLIVFGDPTHLRNIDVGSGTPSDGR